MIYLSTGGCSSKTACEYAKELSTLGLVSFELSGGLHDPNVNYNLQQLASEFNISLHNYFPPPKEPFVLNLASFDPIIHNRSISHVKDAINICHRLSIPFYSFHAGFLIDPLPTELGKKISSKDVQARVVTTDYFIETVIALAEYAQNKGVKLFLENNVLTSTNLRTFGCDPLLMSDTPSCKYIFSNLPSSVGFLLDVAHLKVSATTLDFSASSFIEEMNPYICAYHLSDNNGLVDSNQPFAFDSWFWDFLKIDDQISFYTIEVYSRQPSLLATQSKILSSILFE